MSQIQFFIKRKVLLLSATFFLLGFLSCKKEENNLGANIQPGGDLLGNLIIDSLSLLTYSVADDSMRVDETTRSLLGSYVDPVFGKMQCGFISQFRLESDEPNFGDISSLTVDSIVISLKYSGAYGGLDEQNFVVYRLLDNLDITENYYRYSEFNIDNQNLVQVGQALIKPDIFSPSIVGSDTLTPELRIRLDNAFGEEIVNQSGTGNLANNEAFSNWLKGLYIGVENPSQNTNEGGIFYFNVLDPGARMNLYFTESGSSRRFLFNINENSARVNVIETDYQATEVEQVLLNPELGQESFFYQAGAIRSVIEFPYLMKLKDSLPNFIINKAELVLHVQYMTGDLLVPPLQVTLASYNKQTNSQSLIFDNFNPNHLGGNFDRTKKQYRFNITRYIQNVIKGELPNDGMRLLSVDHFASVERIIFNGQNTKNKFKPKLELTITTY